MFKIHVNFHAPSQEAFNNDMKRIGEIVKEKKPLSSHLHKGKKESKFVEIIKEIFSLFPGINLSRTAENAVVNSFVAYARQNREYLKDDKNFKVFTKKFLKYREASLKGHTGKNFNRYHALFEKALGKIEDIGKQERLVRFGNGGVYYKSALPTFKGIQNKKEIAVLEKAAQQGDIDAINELALAYEAGVRVKKNLPKAFELYKSSADKGNAYALFKVGRFYEKGLGVGSDQKLAAKYYKAAVKKNFHIAGRFLGAMYKEGRGVKKNDAKAAIYLLERQKNPKAYDISLKFFNNYPLLSK